MDHFAYRAGQLHADDVPLSEVADRFGTPTLVYSAEALAERFYRFVEAFGEARPTVCFSSKAAPNASVMGALVRRGAGLSVGSAEDLERAWLAGAPMNRVVLCGPGRTDEEIRAALDGLYSPLFQAGRRVGGRPPYYRGPIGQLSVGSEQEAERAARIAAGLRIACRVLIRVRPEGAEGEDGAHGLALPEAGALARSLDADGRVRLGGLHLHVDRGDRSPGRYRREVERLVSLADDLASDAIDVRSMNIGGGFSPEEELATEDYASAIVPAVAPWVRRGARVVLEPGRAIASGAGVLLARVVEAQEGDAGTLLHDGWTPEALDAEPAPLLDGSGRAGAFVALRGCGAYTLDGATHRPAVVLVERGRARLVRRRRSLVDRLDAEIDLVE